MGLSPAQRHSQRIAMQQQLSRLEAINTADSLHMQVQELNADIERLSGLPTVADKISYKRETLLPKWLPTAEAYLDLGKVYANPVFSYCVVWLFDAGEYDKALEWADIAIEQQQDTPGKISSRFQAFVADQMLAWAEQAARAGEELEPYFSWTFDRVTEHWPLHEKIVAKWFKFAGLHLLRDENGHPRPAAISDVATLQKADAMLAAAEAKHQNIGVGTMRSTVAARIRSLSQ
ncbi:phage terminase small subunit [Klebsiella variicola]|uniref:phage terminase small subunit n=1 Tax=Klebsiella variicola TaxID=244366 RepID=UPI001955389B|nr:phage terminase small subunit [Klebsiella variicola]